MLKKSLNKILILVSYLYPFKGIKLIKELNNRLYGYKLCKKLADVGPSLNISADSLIIGAENISIGACFQSFARLRIEAISNYRCVEYFPKIKIGNNVAINFDCHIGAINRIEIGDNVLIGSRVTIVDHSHGKMDASEYKLSPSMRILHSKGPVCIGHNVWIGEGVIILDNVRLGKNVIVGANSVVNKSFPPNVVIAGNPARIVKSLLLDESK